MAAYTNGDTDRRGRHAGLTDLVLVGDGLWMITAEEARYKHALIRRISFDPLYNASYNISIAQAGQSLSFWFTNGEHTLGYQQASNDGKLLGDPIPLRPAGSSIDYAAILDPRSKSQSLIVVSGTHEVLLMEQAIETGMWNTRPLLITAPDGLIETDAFVSHVELRDAEHKPLSLTKLNISASGWVNLLVNGTEYAVGETPRTVETDEMGILTIVQPSDDISAYTYNLSNVPDGTNIFPSTGFLIDPSVKVQAKIGSLTTPEALRKAGAEGSQEDLEAAARAISKMHGLIKDVSNSSSRSTQGDSTPSTSVVPSFSDIIEMKWDLWEWVKVKAQEVKEFVMKKVKDAWQFVVNIAGAAWSFILDSASAVLKAVAFVLGKVKMVGGKIGKFFQFIFDWKDIKATADGLKRIVNSSLDYAELNVEGAGQKALGCLDNLRDMLNRAMDVKLPDGLGSKDQSKTDASVKADKTPSVEANTALYHFNQGAKSARASTVMEEGLKGVFEKVLKPPLNRAEEATHRIANTLKELFGKGSVSVEEVLKALGGSFVDLVVSLFKGLVEGLKNLGVLVVRAFKSLVNAPLISFPVIGPLLKWIGFSELTILDVAAYVVAIPINVLAKTLTGRSPTLIQNYDSHSMSVNGKLDTATAAAMNELAGYIAIPYATITTFTSVFKVGTAELPLELETFSITTLIFDLLKTESEYPYEEDASARDARSVLFALCNDRGELTHLLRLSIWWLALTNLLVKAVCQKAGVTRTLFIKLLSAADILAAVATFSLNMVVHHADLTGPPEKRDVPGTGLDISGNYVEMVKSVSTGVGVITLEPVGRQAAVIMIGAAGVVENLVKTGKALKDSEEGTVEHVKPDEDD